MDNKIILTIGRQFGSGGREVGQKLAKELGIGYYDKELMALAAKESGLSEEFFEKADEKASSGLAYALRWAIRIWGCSRRMPMFCLTTVCSCIRAIRSVTWRKKVLV